MTAGRRPRGLRRTLLRASGPLVLVGLFATLAAGLQVNRITVTGAEHFPATEIETALRSAMGRSPVALHADDLRDEVLRIDWVADATIRIGLDGEIVCAVREREGVAVAVDGLNRMLVDAEGHLLAPAGPGAPPLEIRGFAGFGEQRRNVLRSVPSLEKAWQARLLAADRLGPNDVALHFEGAPCPVIADPALPGALGNGRRVLEAWERERGAAPSRIDVRAAGLVAVAPGEAGS